VTSVTTKCVYGECRATNLCREFCVGIELDKQGYEIRDGVLYHRPIPEEMKQDAE
jgi:hypothetical protein